MLAMVRGGVQERVRQERIAALHHANSVLATEKRSIGLLVSKGTLCTWAEQNIRPSWRNLDRASLIRFDHSGFVVLLTWLVKDGLDRMR